MTHLTTHILDATTGVPATDVAVTLFTIGGLELASGRTDSDGRLAIGPDKLDAGAYSLQFATGEYFERDGREHFYPSVSVTFTVADREHYHVPLLLSPFAYSTYRGS